MHQKFQFFSFILLLILKVEFESNYFYHKSLQFALWKSNLEEETNLSGSKEINKNLTMVGECYINYNLFLDEDFLDV